jgi:hypothetical protein
MLTHTAALRGLCMQSREFREHDKGSTRTARSGQPQSRRSHSARGSDSSSARGPSARSASARSGLRMAHRIHDLHAAPASLGSVDWSHAFGPGPEGAVGSVSLQVPARSQPPPQPLSQLPSRSWDLTHATLNCPQRALARVDRYNAYLPRSARSAPRQRMGLTVSAWLCGCGWLGGCGWLLPRGRLLPVAPPPPPPPGCAVLALRMAWL